MDPEQDEKNNDNTDTSDTSSSDQNRMTYEGPHMIHLRQALQKTRKKCMDSLKYNTFARKYTFAHEEAPHILRNVLAEFREQLDNNIKGELEEMITQENLVPLFNTLDQIIKEHSNEENTPAWRPSGIPQIDVQDHLYQVKLEEKEKLLRLLAVTEQETKRLKGLVEKKKEHLNTTQHKIQEHLHYFEKATEACIQTPLAEIESCQIKL